MLDMQISFWHNSLMHKTPAELVINAFGGVSAAAIALDRNPGSVSRWQKKRKDGAPDGSIPVAMHKKILRVAKRRNLGITTTDLIYGR